MIGYSSCVYILQITDSSMSTACFYVYCTQKKFYNKKALGRLELPSRESEPRVITTYTTEPKFHKYSNENVKFLLYNLILIILLQLGTRQNSGNSSKQLTV